MLSSLLRILIAGLILFVIYYLASLLIHGTILTIIGVVLVIVLLIYALKELGIGL
jgi:hypothetical protein